MPSISNKSLSLIFPNTWSFSKHAIDVFKDKRLLQASIFCLTEAQITLAQNTQMPE